MSNINRFITLIAMGLATSAWSEQQDAIGGIGGTGADEEIIGGIGGTGIRDMERPERLERPDLLEDRDILEDILGDVEATNPIDDAPNASDLPDTEVP